MSSGIERHRTDLVALVTGLGFLTIGFAALARQLDWFEAGGRALLGAVLVVLGVLGAAGIVAASMRRLQTRPEADESRAS